MALQKRNGMWYADLRATGGPRVSLKTRDERVAREKHAALELQHLRGQDVRSQGGGGGLSLEEAVRRALAGEWADYRRKLELRANLDEMLQEFGSKAPLARIETAHLSRWVQSLRERGLTGATINRKLAVISRLMHLGVVWGSVDKVPHIPRQRESKGNIRWYTEEEERKVLAWCAGGEASERLLGRLVVFLADTGWRLNEALSLTWDRAQERSLLLNVEDQKGKRQTRTPMTARVLSVLTTLKIDGLERPFPLADWQAEKLWARVRVELGLGDDATLHAWRHTTATRLVQRGVDVRTVMDYMRHQDIRTTMRYVHLAGSRLEGAVAALSQAAAHSDAVANGDVVVPFRRQG